MHTDSPYDRSSLIASLSAVEEDMAEFFGSLSPDEFVLRVESAWTPAEHLQHLNTSVSAVARGFSISRWLLRLRFGRVRRPSRSYEQLRDEYLARLATGGGATGRFVPAREEVGAEKLAAYRAGILARWHRVNSRLVAALHTWSERDLDRIQLPHPLLGRITARELVFFTIYHNEHHVRAAKARLPRFSSAGSSA